MPNPTLPDYDWLISALPTLEQKLLPDISPPLRIFLHSGEQYWLPASSGNIPQILRGFTKTGDRKNRLVAAAKSCLGKGLKIQTSANSIRLCQINKGVRIFYPNVTLKARQAPQTASSATTNPLPPTWWEREKLGRDDIQKKLGDSIKTPKVLAFGEEAGVAYCLEERVSCQPINPQIDRDRQRMKDQFTPLLMKWYETVEWQPLSTAFKTTPDLLFHQALTSPAMAEIKSAQADTFRQLVDHFSTYEVDVPFSICHGDMCINNVGVTPTGEFILLDWETWGTHPIVAEFARFIISFSVGSEIHNAIRQIYAQRFEQPPEAFEFQLLFYYLLEFSQKLISYSQMQNPQERYRRLQKLPFLDAATEMGQLLKLM
ncbi:phosphotransferase [Oscillatoria acuminata]|uniref:Phosphotransferase family protein n=1 Tax=Oscillatoria acuminata PCC 6304 TaxID=56110 RepID=K9TPK9_9CYAN|nr:phosphotransferase [Oscillatoria acuminata]AFY84323.1 phosphotransferase family protein [Oscillatoria acuminata PCC 6304]